VSGGTFRGRRERRDYFLVVRFPRRLLRADHAKEIGRPVRCHRLTWLTHVFIGCPDKLPTWRRRYDDRRHPGGRIRDLVGSVVARVIPVRFSKVFPEVFANVFPVATAGRLADPRGMPEDRAVG
jgi:hypothetical protein